MTQPLARWKDLCIDAVDVAAAADFWGAVLGLQRRTKGSNVHLVGSTPAHTVWLNEVAEPHTVKNRVHLDVHAASVESVQALGASFVGPVLPAWTVLGDPDGQEFCVFPRETVPDYRLYELVVDCADPAAIARWWGTVFGVEPELDADGDASLRAVPGAPWEYLVFVRVPEPKIVKNRVHWDVDVADVQVLLDAGATLLRERGGDIDWWVLADPDGNEFCAFA